MKLLLLIALVLLPLMSCAGASYQKMSEPEFALLVDDIKALAQTGASATLQHNADDRDELKKLEDSIRAIALGTVPASTLAEWSVSPLYSPLIQRVLARLSFYIGNGLLDDRARLLVVAVADGLALALYVPPAPPPTP